MAKVAYRTDEKENGPLVRTDYSTNTITIAISDTEFLSKREIEDTGKLVAFRLREIKDGMRHTSTEGVY